MLLTSEIEARLAGADFDRRGFLLGGASSLAILSTADAQLLGLHPGGGQPQPAAPSGATPIALAGVNATPSLNLTQTNNTLNATSGVSAAAVLFPSGAMTTPSTGANGWFCGFFFQVPQY